MTSRDGAGAASAQNLGLNPHGSGHHLGVHEVRVPNLVGRRVRLRPVTPDDYDWLYDVALSPEIGFRWRNRGATPSPEAFVEGLWRGVLAQFMVERIQSDETIGNVFAYSADHMSGVASVAIMVLPKYTKQGWALEAAGLFVDYLFRVWNFRKLYADSPDYTAGAFSGGVGRFFREEGCLRDHEYYDGRYWDLHIFALYRDEWEKIADDWQRRREARRSSGSAETSETAVEQ